MDLLANEFARLRGWGFAFALVASRASQGFLLGHCVTSRNRNLTQRPFQKPAARPYPCGARSSARCKGHKDDVATKGTKPSRTKGTKVRPVGWAAKRPRVDSGSETTSRSTCAAGLWLPIPNLRAVGPPCGPT